MSAAATLDRLAAGRAPVTLAEVTATADLATRVDRKYVVPMTVVAELEARLGARLTVLEIDGRRRFGYESVYFDTPDLASFRGAVGGRRHRFKVRTRVYEATGACALEVKRRGRRDQTVKERTPYDAVHRFALTPAARSFVAERIDEPGRVDHLRPTLTTRYDRSTFVADDRTWRLTVDADLVCRRTDGAELVLADRLVVESKSAGPPTPVDRVLWDLGVRPVSISKYGVGMAGLDPTLPAGQWAPVLRRHFGLRRVDGVGGFSGFAAGPPAPRWPPTCRPSCAACRWPGLAPAPWPPAPAR